MTRKNKGISIHLGTANINKVGKRHKIEPYERDATTTAAADAVTHHHPPNVQILQLVAPLHTNERIGDQSTPIPH